LPELFCGFKRASGESPIAYPVACLPQAWAAGSVFMLVQSCLGIEIDAHADNVLVNRPLLPAGIESLGIVGLSVGANRFDLAFRRVNGGVVAFVEPTYGSIPTRVEMRL
jgi:glycogen debranching enzyme